MKLFFYLVVAIIGYVREVGMAFVFWMHFTELKIKDKIKPALTGVIDVTMNNVLKWIKTIFGAFKALPLASIEAKFKKAIEAKDAKEWVTFAMYLAGGLTLLGLAIAQIVQSF